MQAPDARIIFPDENELTDERCIEEGLMRIPRDELETTVNMNRGQRKNWMRNKPCICGSERKFKKCCWSKYSGR
jgi:uncharacterized protein YecA (UPF0149 family)